MEAPSNLIAANTATEDKAFFQLNVLRVTNLADPL